jgi:hypothetical protein
MLRLTALARSAMPVGGRKHIAAGLVLRERLEDDIPLTYVAAQSGIPHRTLQRWPARGRDGSRTDPAYVDLDVAVAEVIDDVVSVGQGAGEPVELGHHQRRA